MSTYAQPRFHIVESYTKSYGQAAVQIAALAGIECQDWQSDVLNDLGAIDENGQFIHRKFGGSIPRQTGKSVSGEAWTIFLAVALGAKVLWTDHNYQTTCEMVRRFKNVFGSQANDPLAKYPYFNDLVDRVNNKTAQEAIFLKNGGSIHFSTRTKSSALGFSFDVIVYDEAQELTDEQQQAILPTQTSGAMGNPQALYLGTPPRPTGFGTVFAQQRILALDDKNPPENMCWWEWGVDEVGDVRDEKRWRQVNPSIGRVANIEAIRDASTSMSALAFAQEYLGYWLPAENLANSLIFKREKWDACATDDPPVEGRTAFAMKFSMDGAHGVIAVCRRPKDGIPHVEVVHDWSMSEGTSRFVDFAMDRFKTASGFVVDGGGNAQAVYDELLLRKAPRNAVIKPTSTEMCAAASKLESAVSEQAITHFAQGELDTSILWSIERPIGNSGHGYKPMDDDHDSTMAEAIALALWGIDKIRRDPSRKMKVL